jgi:hypothetical protein
VQTALEQHDARAGARSDSRQDEAGFPASTRQLAGRLCPICQHAARFAEGAATGWYFVEGCVCAGFFVAEGVLEWRLPRLTSAERADLLTTIHGFHAMGRDAWLSTSDGTMSGRLLVRATAAGNSV